MIFKINKPKFFTSVLFLIFTLLIINSIQAQTTAFNFQGRLNDGGNAANGRYDLQFKLFDALAGGNQINSTIDRTNLQVINGVFSTTLDFGAAAFGSGNRFIEISVRPNASANAYVVLGARQQVLSVPFSARSAVSTNSDTATTAQNSLSLGGISSSEFARLNFVNIGDLKTTGSLVIDGNARQLSTSNGIMKAMIYAKPTPNGNPTIVRCYNGITNSSTGNCGFTIEQVASLSGVYTIDFGFNITSRIVSITAEYASGCAPLPPSCGGLGYNYGANFRPGGTNNTLGVYTFAAGNSTDTTQAAFQIVLY